MLHKALQILKTSSIPGKTVTRDVEIFSKLMVLLDHPYRSFKNIHITGTNGKGSTTIKTASVLQQCGYTVGMYTSPHIFDFTQRISINGKLINQTFFSQTIVSLNKLQHAHNLELTFFQYLTATAFLYYKQNKCQFVALEVGLGGRFDTTNVVIPEVSVITSIAIDHQRILGNTREKIAWEKAGIIKQGRPLVIGPNAELPIVFQEAKKLNSKVYTLPQRQFQTFDEENTAISRKTLQVLRQNNVAQISTQAMQLGLKAQQPCRMQLHQNLPEWTNKKRIIFDVGHNPNAITKIIEYFNKKLRVSPSQKVCIIFGASKQKNSSQSLSLLQQFASLIYLVQAQNHHRAMPVTQLSQYVGSAKYPQKFRIVGDGEISKAMMYALADKEINTVIVCGSFYIMPQAKAFLKLGNKTTNQRDLSEQYDMKNPKNF